MRYKLQYVANKAKELLIKSKRKRIDKQSATSNPIDTQLGDKILLKTENNRKLDKVYDGPYEVISVNHPKVTIKHCKTNKQKTVHKNRVIKLKETEQQRNNISIPNKVIGNNSSIIKMISLRSSFL